VLTGRRRVLLEQSVVIKLIKTLPVYTHYGISTVIPVFTLPPPPAPLLSVTRRASSHRFSILLRTPLNSLNKFLNLEFRRKFSFRDALIDSLNYVPRAAKCPSLKDTSNFFYERLHFANSFIIQYSPTNCDVTCFRNNILS
jgi:hypothetical protein